jgi:alanyl-tRNA synthetase
MHDVESRVNAVLLEDLVVSAQVMSQSEAKAMGAMALFSEKYGDRVRVISVGDWAHELCGGTHVSSSAQLGLVKLLSESSIGAGVRRVEALVGRDAFDFLAKEHVLLNSLTDLIKGARVEELPERISALLERMKIIEKELAAIRTAQAIKDADALLTGKFRSGEVEFITAQLTDGITAEDLRQIATNLRNQLANGVVALISNSSDRATLVVSTSGHAQSLGIKAGVLVKIGSTVLGGGGGGKDDVAQGGGINLDMAGQALSEISTVIKSFSNT